MTTEFHVYHRSLLLASLLVVVLVSSLFVCVVVGGVNGASLENAVHVKNEGELEDAIKNSAKNTASTIALDNDITLTKTLKIPSNKDITLTSNKDSGYHRLIGANGYRTIEVDDYGVLRLDTVLSKQAF